MDTTVSGSIGAVRLLRGRKLETDTTTKYYSSRIFETKLTTGLRFRKSWLKLGIRCFSFQEERVGVQD